MAEIQRNIVNQGKRNVFSRHFHAKTDKETIAGWRLDLNRILHVFNVRSIPSVRISLTVRPQTELAINTNVVVTSTHTIVSEIHRTMVESRGVAGGKYQVSVTHITLITESTLISPRLKPGQPS